MFLLFGGYSPIMERLEEVFDEGKAVIEERHGSWEDEPQDFELEYGLLENGMAAHTRADVPVSQNGRVMMFSDDVTPNTITVDRELAEGETAKAEKSLLHELYEWHAAESIPANRYLRGESHVIAEYNENSLCQAVEDRLDRPVCDQDWNNEFDTAP